MEDLIRTIKSEMASQCTNIDTVTLRVLFSEGHISCIISVDGKEVNYEIGAENTLKIYEYVNKFAGSHNNRLNMTIKEDEIFEKFDFDENYYISSNQRLLNLIIEKSKDNLNIEIQELKDLLSIAKYAITRVDLRKVASRKCKLYLEIESCQLVTDIPPNFVKNNDKYLFLCEISREDNQQSNLESILLRKIKQNYRIQNS